MYRNQIYPSDLISLATFKIKKPLYIYDFSTDIDKDLNVEDTLFGMNIKTFFTELMYHYTQPVANKDTYRVTQVISDHLRKTGIDGIGYKSYFCPNGINYTIFNSHPSVIEYCGSRVVLHKRAIHSFWDFNNETAIVSSDTDSLAYNPKVANQHREHLLQRFKYQKDEDTCY